MERFARRSILAMAALCMAAVTGCASFTDNGQPAAQPDTFAWFDLGSDNPEASRAFYQGLFGWKFSGSADGAYWTIKAGRTPLGGIFPTSDDDTNTQSTSQWIPVIGVTDAVAASKTAFALGASQVAPIAQTSDGIYSSILDPLGAPLDLYQGTSGIPIADAGDVGTWIWADHISSSPSRAGKFYTALFGWTDGKNDRGMRVLELAGNEVGGLVYVASSEAEPNWLPYVAVSDLNETILKSAELGGRLLVRTDDAAVLIDPTGAAVGVIETGA